MIFTTIFSSILNLPVPADIQNCAGYRLVQQFVQRCFLHLEQDINVDLSLDPEWSQWQSMMYFRVWQDRVMVFCRPENWIEPELLPKEIKSPFFKELENELLPK